MKTIETRDPQTQNERMRIPAGGAEYLRRGVGGARFRRAVLPSSGCGA